MKTIDPQLIALLIAIIVAVIILALGLTVVRFIWRGKIDLTMLLTEISTDSSGAQKQKASLSRFQFLVFTFVVAGLYFVLSLETGHLIDVPNGTLILLGISGVSYLGGKTLSSGSPASQADNVKAQAEQAKALADVSKALTENTQATTANTQKPAASDQALADHAKALADVSKALTENTQATTANTEATKK